MWGRLHSEHWWSLPKHLATSCPHVGFVAPKQELLVEGLLINLFVLNWWNIWWVLLSGHTVLQIKIISLICLTYQLSFPCLLGLHGFLHNLRVGPLPPLNQVARELWGDFSLIQRFLNLFFGRNCWLNLHFFINLWKCWFLRWRSRAFFSFLDGIVWYLEALMLLRWGFRRWERLNGFGTARYFGGHSCAPPSL